MVQGWGDRRYSVLPSVHTEKAWVPVVLPYFHATASPLEPAQPHWSLHN